ncbi:MAG: hypothetical protein C6I00_04675 [Nitratiruptor sp.]|nr:hypothetical protein [Nitratiruptor sp.]NPA84203.1 GNAT family N-acetyltransferase [Campylobacterota bacterium]
MSIAKATYSPKLISQWRALLQETFGFQEYMDLMIQPSLGGRPTLTYLPLLNYTDRTSDQIDDLLELAKDNPYLIRTLNFQTDSFQEYDPVTMRLEIGGKSIEEVMGGYRRLAKRSIRKERECQRYRVEIGYTPKMRDHFYWILQTIYRYHGTPILPKSFFEAFQSYIPETKIALLWEQERLVGGLWVFYDREIVTLQYGGTIYDRRTNSTGYFFYHTVIEHLVQEQRASIIDFGRSPYGVGTYFFKSRFGAYPVKIDLHTHKPTNIYKAYQLASTIWSHLPAPLTNWLGPRIAPYLVEL